MSLLKTGLLQLSPESAVIGEVTYYDRGPVVVDRVDRESIAEALGTTSKVPAGCTLCLRYGTMTLLAVTYTSIFECNKCWQKQYLELGSQKLAYYLCLCPFGGFDPAYWGSEKL